MKSKFLDQIISISAIGFVIVFTLSLGIIGLRLTDQNSQVLAKNPTVTVIQVVVEPGDTLWSIARTQVPGGDPRDIVGNIREINQLSSAEIFPGQVLDVEIALDVRTIKLARQLSNE